MSLCLLIKFFRQHSDSPSRIGINDEVQRWQFCWWTMRGRFVPAIEQNHLRSVQLMTYCVKCGKIASQLLKLRISSGGKNRVLKEMNCLNMRTDENFIPHVALIKISNYNKKAQSSSEGCLFNVWQELRSLPTKIETEISTLHRFISSAREVKIDAVNRCGRITIAWTNHRYGFVSRIVSQVMRIERRISSCFYVELVILRLKSVESCDRTDFASLGRFEKNRVWRRQND